MVLTSSTLHRHPIDHALTGSDNELIYGTSVKNLVQSAMEGYNGEDSSPHATDGNIGPQRLYPAASLLFCLFFFALRNGVCIRPNVFWKDLRKEPGELKRRRVVNRPVCPLFESTRPCNIPLTNSRPSLFFFCYVVVFETGRRWYVVLCCLVE